MASTAGSAHPLTARRATAAVRGWWPDGDHCVVVGSPRPNLQFDILPDGDFRHDCRRFALGRSTIWLRWAPSRARSVYIAGDGAVRAVIVNCSTAHRSMASSYAASASWDFSRHLDQLQAIQVSDSSVASPGLRPLVLGHQEDTPFTSSPKRPRVAWGAATVASRPRDAGVDT